MNEEIVIEILKKAGIDLVASLPCDKNKRLTAMLPDFFRTVGLTREEDGVGICAGAFLAGRRPVLSIQSSGIGNMLNALMSLTVTYSLPLPILASWRGVCHEAICAQIPFNEPLPRLLEVYGIPYRIFSSGEDLEHLDEVIAVAFEKRTPSIALILPSCWGPETDCTVSYPIRRIPEVSVRLPPVDPPEMIRAEAIQTAADFIPDDAVLISNIGVPSKELYAAQDRALNFYMLGSYTQASALGLGCALGSSRPVYVIDGDGSLLGSSVLPVIAVESPSNLTILALDNGTFGSTGNQINPAYDVSDLGLTAAAAGISTVRRACAKTDFIKLLEKKESGPRFIHTFIWPGNSNVSPIPLTPAEIRDRFMAALSRS